MEGTNSQPVQQQVAGAAAEDPTKNNPESQRHTTVTEITQETDFAHHTSSFPSNALLVIYFHAPWAAPCKQMSTVLSTLASTYPVQDPPTITFLSVNAEELPEISERYDVTAVPYIVLQRDGKTVETISGGDAAKVRDAVEKHAGRAGEPGKLGFPPAQKVTRPAEPVRPTTQQATTTNGAGGSGVSAQDRTDETTNKLSSYAPTPSDPSTAPQFSGSGQDSSEPESKEELFRRLGDLVKAAPVMLFMKGTPSAPQCGFSRQLVSMLRERSIRYGFFNILADDDVRQGMKDFADWPTFPQLWVGGELVGGLDIVSPRHHATPFPSPCTALTASSPPTQVKEEFGNDPDFLVDYAVSPNRNAGGPADADRQRIPA